MRVLVTGDRNWGNAEIWGRAEAERQVYRLKCALTALHAIHPGAIIIHGAAKGADSIAGVIAADLFGADHVEAYPAEWTKYGKSAGPRRNQQMLDTGIDCAIVCHRDLKNSKGTLDMVNRLLRVLAPDQLLYLSAA
jgi:hypothetical protein